MLNIIQMVWGSQLGTPLQLVWGCANVTTMHKLLILQKTAVRINSNITRSPYRAASNPLVVYLRLLKVNYIYTFQLATFMFKFIRFPLPSSCRTFFLLNCALLLTFCLVHQRTKHVLLTSLLNHLSERLFMNTVSQCRVPGFGIPFPVQFVIAHPSTV